MDSAAVRALQLHVTRYQERFQTVIYNDILSLLKPGSILVVMFTSCDSFLTVQVAEEVVTEIF
jgi:hypothetical protein